MHAHGEAAALLERAIELWDRVPNAEELAGTDRAGLLRRAAADHRADGDFSRTETLARKALEEIDENADPYRAATVLELLARAQWALFRGPASIDTIQHALSLLPKGDPSRERARLLGFLAKVRMLQGKYMETLEVAEQAIDAADRCDDPLAEGRARNARGIALAAMGDVEAGTAELRRAVELAREREFVSELDSAYGNLADALHLAGRTREGLAIVEEGQRVISEIMRPVEWLNVTIAEFNWALGDWTGRRGGDAGHGAPHGRRPRGLRPAAARHDGARLRRRGHGAATASTGQSRSSPSPPSRSTSAPGVF